ncbi:hypothetical protein Pint_29648 [Pistacia integerrima]|uniref:Uncharacterized protein n=1 Tax=Pistacia integerrima TaxID=434235 RepID=A0ACC0X029_9ROSI|nr:hypothetical protein Pint_29648 [Pistacia integerrima]
MKFLVVAHKVMWEAVAFMAAPFVAATLVIMPHGQRNRWTFETSNSNFDAYRARFVGYHAY